MKFLTNTISLFFAVFLMVLPVFGVTLLTGLLEKVENLLNDVDGKLEKFVDLPLLNATLTDIDNIADPLINKLGVSIDALLTKLLD